MPHWWRLALTLTLLSSLMILVVIPSTVDVATAGPQLSGISSNGIDFGDDLDDNFDVLLVTAIADGPPDLSRPLSVCPARSGAAESTSAYRPPDRGPPARDTAPQIYAPTASHQVVRPFAHHPLDAFPSIDHPSVGDARPRISAFARLIRSCVSPIEESAQLPLGKGTHHG